MKKLINVLAVIALLSPVATKAMTDHSTVKTDTTIDPKKGPFTVDLDKHPEIKAKVLDMMQKGQIRFMNAPDTTDTTLDLSKHPELVKAIIRNPKNWPIILKAYDHENQSTLGGGKQVIRDIIAYLIREHIVKNRQEIDSFLLTDTELTVNGKKLSDKRHDYLKEQYILRPGYVVYYGNSGMKGDGIFQRTDNL